MNTSHRLLPLLLGLLCAGAAPADEITVFAAASLKTALDAVAADWQERSGDAVTLVYGGSAALAAQIEHGAPADIFLSAATDWMDRLAEQDLILADTRLDLLGNRLVLVAHGDAAAVNITPDLDLTGLLAGGRLSMALVEAVPAGQYGKQALQSLGLWTAVEPSLAQSENVRAALALVATGEAPYGIVYASDAIADDQADNSVTVVGTFPADSHRPIVYPAAILTDTPNAVAATAFMAHLSSDAADAIFAAQGFAILD